MAPNLLLVWAGELHNLEDPNRIPRSYRLFLIFIWCYLFVVIFGRINMSTYGHPLMSEIGCSSVTFLKEISTFTLSHSTISFPPKNKSFHNQDQYLIYIHNPNYLLQHCWNCSGTVFFRQKSFKFDKKRKRLKNHNHWNMAKQKRRQILSVLVIQLSVCATPLNLEFI